MSQPVRAGGSVVRVVRMTFHPDRVDDFLRLFDERSPQIRSFSGCRHLDLLRDVRYHNVMTTLSVWDSEDDLAAYRKSDLFEETWSLTRLMFADRPAAHSYVTLREIYPRED